MSSRKPVVPEGVQVEQLRQAARQRVADTSLRIAAGEIDMSHRGLEGFIKGARPHPKTVQKLTAWYFKRVAAGDTTISSEVAQAALAVLVQHLPLDRREGTANQILTALRQETETSSCSIPRWLLSVRGKQPI